jgi:hypothetical protein
MTFFLHALMVDWLESLGLVFGCLLMLHFLSTIVIYLTRLALIQLGFVEIYRLTYFQSGEHHTAHFMQLCLADLMRDMTTPCYLTTTSISTLLMLRIVASVLLALLTARSRCRQYGVLAPLLLKQYCTHILANRQINFTSTGSSFSTRPPLPATTSSRAHAQSPPSNSHNAPARFSV